MGESRKAAESRDLYVTALVGNEMWVSRLLSAKWGLGNTRDCVPFVFQVTTWANLDTLAALMALIEVQRKVHALLWLFQFDETS